MADSGATDFVDIEGGGIGEGEGVTDVSDQIETEDQVGLGGLFFVSSSARGAMGRRIDPSWGGPIELFLIPASAPRLV